MPDAHWIVLYDGECGFCKWLLGGLLSLDGAGALRPVALQLPEAAVLLPDLGAEERMASFHLISPDGARSSGGAALPPLFRLLRGGPPLAGLFASFPRLTDRGYRWTADHRTGLSRLVPQRLKRRGAEQVRARERQLS